MWQGAFRDTGSMRRTWSALPGSEGAVSQERQAASRSWELPAVDNPSGNRETSNGLELISANHRDEPGSRPFSRNCKECSVADALILASLDSNHITVLSPLDFWSTELWDSKWVFSKQLNLWWFVMAVTENERTIPARNCSWADDKAVTKGQRPCVHGIYILVTIPTYWKRPTSHCYLIPQAYSMAAGLDLLGSPVGGDAWDDVLSSLVFFIYIWVDSQI